MFLWGCFLQVLAVIIDNDIVFVYSQILVTSILGWLGHDIPLLWSNISLYFQFEEYMDSRDARSGAFTLTFTLIFTLIFTLTFTLHLQIDGASSCSIERHFWKGYSVFTVPLYKFWMPHELFHHTYSINRLVFLCKKTSTLETQTGHCAQDCALCQTF